MNYLKQLIPIFTLLLITSCDQECYSEFDNINNKILAMGHGGMGFMHKYPINSFESIKNSLSIGADGTEMDVQLSKDGVLVAFHDETLDEKTNLKGMVNAIEWKQIEIGRYDKLPNGEFMIVSVNDIFMHIKNVKRYHFSFDCKLNPATTDTLGYYNEFAESIADIVTKYNVGENIYIESRSMTFLNLIREKVPNVKRFYYASGFEKALEIGKQKEVDGIVIEGEEISEEEIRILHELNLLVSVFGGKTRNQNKRLIEKNPDMIQSDHLSSLIDMLH